MTHHSPGESERGKASRGWRFAASGEQSGYEAVGTVRVVWAATAVVTVVFTVVAWFQFNALRYGLDTGVVVNVLWRLAHGYDSSTALTGSTYLADHPSLLLPALVPAAWLLGKWTVFLLLGLQAISVSTVAWSVWRVARAKGIECRSAFSLFLVTLLGSGAWFAAVGEFHMVDLALGPLAAAAANVAIGNYRRALVWATVAASVRIEIALVVVLMGLVWQKDSTDAGRRIAAAGLVVGIAIVGVALVAGASVLGEGASLGAHFGYVGTTPREVFGRGSTDPSVLWSQLTAKNAWFALFFWLASFGLYPALVGARRLLPAMPMIATPFLGSWAPADWYFEHYWHVLLVFGGLAAVEGFRSKGLSQQVQRLLLVGSATALWLVVGPMSNTLPSVWGLHLSARDVTAVEVSELVPPGVSASVNPELATVFADREHLWFLPRPFGCVGTASWLPTLPLLEGAKPPAFAVGVRSEIGDPGVRAALSEDYGVTKSVGRYSVWELVDPDSAGRRMRACASPAH